MTTTELRVTDTAGNHQFAIVDDTTGQDIALVYNRNEQSKETAQLLSAAPELLEALEDLLYYSEFGTAKMKDQMRNKAKNAIQKATHHDTI